MKRLTTLLLFILINHLPSSAQQWVSVRAVTTGTVSFAVPGLVAVSNDALISAPMTALNLHWGSHSFGDYKITEYDTSGVPGNSITINGRMELINAQCDVNGNYYILGKYHDTATFSTGFQAARNEPGTAPTQFIFRLDKHTLALKWFKLLGANENATAQCFTVKNGSVYVFIDTLFNSNVLYKYDATTGAESVVLSHGGDRTVTSIQVDDHDNIYVAGSSVSVSSFNFNGHVVPIPPSFQYPAYIVRYKAGGVYDWSHLMTDVTTVPRQLTLAGNNTLYYSGAIFDSFTLGGFHLHRPRWTSDYIVSMIDSAGSVQWVRQLKDTLSGDAKVNDYYHATAGKNGSLYVINNIRNFVDWGNGIASNCNNNGSTSVISYAPNGDANWVLSAVADVTQSGYIGTDGKNIWISGTGFDSTAMHFGSLSIPSSYYSYRPFLAKINPDIPGPVKANTIATPVSVSVFPNPATEYLYITGTASSMISVMDITGKKMYNDIISAGTQERISVSSWPRGTYFLEIAANGQRFVKKVILQ